MTGWSEPQISKGKPLLGRTALTLIITAYGLSMVGTADRGTIAPPTILSARKRKDGERRPWWSLSCYKPNGYVSGNPGCGAPGNGVTALVSSNQM
jgi:hypothetical protein